MSGAGRSATGLGYRIPGLGWRITVGALRLIPLFLLLVGLPAAAVAFLVSHGIAAPLSVLTLTVFGVAISALSTARYVGKPTRLFGPLSVASASIALLYTIVLLGGSSYTFAVPNTSLALTLTYRDLLLLLMVVPVLSLAAGVATTIEDARSPRERLPFDFPP